MKKLKPKKANAICLLLLAAGAITEIFGAYAQLRFLVHTGLVLMLGALVFRLIFFRCPHCGRYLDRSSGDFCPHCGKNVNE